MSNRPRTFSTPDADLQWAAAYAADRRRRGIPPQGIQISEVCKNGHERTPENTGHKLSRGKEYRFCKECLAKTTRRGTQKKTAAHDRCPKGHPYTETNTFLDVAGHRRCRICRSSRNTPRKPRGHATQCIHGHEYTQENSYINRRGFKMCKQCGLEGARRRYADKKKAD